MSRGPHDTGRDDVPCRCSACTGRIVNHIAQAIQAEEIIGWVDSLPEGRFRQQQEKGLGLTR